MTQIISKDEAAKTAVVAIEGRVDSSNATQLGAELDALRSEYEGYQFILNAEQMPYISSAGLRVLLKLCKQQGNSLKITHVSTELYEILELTGFSNILDVEKAFRKVSVEGCPSIGEGGYGRVYRLNGDTIVKVYHDDASLDDIRMEQEYSRKAFLAGIPTAIPFDIVDCDGCYGLIYELIDAKTLSATIKEDPSDLDTYARKWAELLKTLHSAEVEPGTLTDVKDIFHDWTRRAASYLTEEEVSKMHALIDRMPDANTLVHGDAHVKNIMMQQDELVLIDMASICVGHPIFDLSGIYLTHMMAGPYCEVSLGLPQEICETLFIKMIHYYFNIPMEESVDYLLQICGAFAMIKFTLAPALGAGTEAQKIAETLIAVSREKFFPIIVQLPGDMLQIFE